MNAQRSKKASMTSFEMLGWVLRLWMHAGSSNTLSFPFLVFRPRTMDQLLRMRENFQTGGEANVAVHGSLKEKGRLCRPRHLRFIW